MGILNDIRDKWREFKMKQNEETKVIPDDVTRDRYLRSLRRQWRVINEQKEKENLKRAISEHFRQETRRNVYGMKEDYSRLKALQEIKQRKAVNILREKRYFLGSKLKKQKTDNGYLGKYEL